MTSTDDNVNINVFGCGKTLKTFFFGQGIILFKIAVIQGLQSYLTLYTVFALTRH